MPQNNNKSHAFLAQLVEQLTFNQLVTGSSPVEGIRFVRVKICDEDLVGLSLRYQQRARC